MVLLIKLISVVIIINFFFLKKRNYTFVNLKSMTESTFLFGNLASLDKKKNKKEKKNKNKKNFFF